MKKRAFDLVTAILVGTATAPVIAGTAALVLATLGRPLFYKEERVGKDGAVFSMYKFRTMSNECDEQGELLPDEQRTSRIMRYIRKSGLDELPQLWNILKGDMSMVGPRPHSLYEFQRAPDSLRSVYQVKPGLTGPSQIVQISKEINSDIALQEEFEYVSQETSIRNDISLMAQSLPVFIKGHKAINNDL